MFRIALEHPDQPEVARLIADLDDYQKPLYPAESHHGIDMAALSRPNVLFAVVRDDTGEGESIAIGCGAVVLNDGWGELKRMFVRPERRGRGIAKALIAFLEAEAAARGCTQMMLETGPLQPEALGLYERAGYLRRGPFGDYGPDPFSVFMHKPLDREAAAHDAGR
jgi:putative acetyltransferase